MFPKFTMSVNDSANINDSRACLLFLELTNNVAFALGVDTANISFNTTANANGNVFIFNICPSGASSIDDVFAEQIFSTVFTCLKIKNHLSPAAQSAVEIIDQKALLRNVYNKEEEFEKDIWILYKNNLNIDNSICALIDYISSKPAVSLIKFGVDGNEFTLSGAKIFDITLPFVECVFDYFEVIEVSLLIKKADFDCTGFWEFKSAGQIIKAKIHPLCRKMLYRISCSCVLGAKYLSVSLALNCKVDITGMCLLNTKRFEIVNIFGEPRDVADNTEIVFKIDSEFVPKISTIAQDQLYLI
ncbi:hypothetical protein CAXC1_310009 [Candidatus Xenohaliotis californiensis]|uniref:Uncharacterized protein n=1 Tax=Candidatus Xenohaliotis californiensis TaxID=84677 RepID=A0ABM9N8E6_9RICK|nr:hypothetical protein CAXC1_310009 [Candidatus Xenohaliotis californiensis]